MKLMKLTKLVLWLVFLSATMSAQEPIITTIAGNGTFGAAGNGGPATAASLKGPVVLAVDNDGTVYVDCQPLVRRISPSGIITVFAGTDTPGYAGDGNPATDARIGTISGLASNGDGVLFIADRYFHAIRKVHPSGTITSCAGNGSGTYSGDGGPAISAGIPRPCGLAMGAAGELYIADTGSRRIRKVDPVGNITTVAGAGTPGYSGDGGAATSAEIQNSQYIATDNVGNIYLSDCANHVVRKVSASGIITTVAGNGVAGYSGDGGAATDAQLNYPSGMAVDADGNLYIADRLNSRIRKVSAGGIISTFSGVGVPGYEGDGGPASAAKLNEPMGLAFDGAGNLYVADRKNFVVRKISGVVQVNNVADEQGVSLYPNPSHGVLFLDGPAGVNYSVSVSNATGQIVFQQNILTQSQFTLPASLPGGGYVVSVISSAATRYFPILLSR